MLDGEPPAKQKHWISHEIGDKVVPKLHACIRASQSLMQGQRLHQQETSALGHRLSSIEAKLDTILQHLKTPPHLSSSDQSPFSHEDDVELVGISVTPSSSLLSPPLSHDWFKLSYDPAKNSKGFAHKKAPPQKVTNRPFSGDNISALDYWNEFYHGSSGKPALNVLEEAYGSTWRSDSKFKRLDGKKGTALKSAWPLQKPIYDYMDLLMDTHPEDVAVAMIQEVFDLFLYKHSKRPNLANKCKKEFFRRWGPLHSIIPILGNIAPTDETVDRDDGDDGGNSSGLVEVGLYVLVIVQLPIMYVPI
jgi:hypothetical protein